MDGQAFVVFIDYSKAFDSISQVEKRFTMTSQLSLDGTANTVLQSRLREE